MGDSFVASVQYGDLKGTVSMDGHEAEGPLGGLAEHTCMKPGYWPVGFGLHGLDPNKEGKCSFTIYAVDASEVGTNVDQIKSYVEENGNLPVVGFHGEIEVGSFIQFFKRFSLRAHSKHIGLEPSELNITGYECGEEN